MKLTNTGREIRRNPQQIISTSVNEGAVTGFAKLQLTATAKCRVEDTTIIRACTEGTPDILGDLCLLICAENRVPTLRKN